MSGLQFNENTLGVGETAAQEINSAWDTVDAVMTNAMKEGFFPTEKPSFGIPEVHPEDLSGSSPEQYAVMYTQLETWQDYATSTLAGIDAFLLQCDNELDILATDIKTKIRKEAMDTNEKKPAEKVIEDAVKANPRYREVLHAQQVMKQKKLMVASTDKAITRRLRILSRYVEIRKENIPGQNNRRSPFG